MRPFSNLTRSDSVFIRCCPFSRDGRIYPIPSAIARTPSLHLSRLRASSFFKPIFSVFSSTCFFQVVLGRPRFLLPLTSRFRATLKTLSSSLLSTCPYHLTPFAVANRSIVSFNPNMSICFSVVFFKKPIVTYLFQKTFCTVFEINSIPNQTVVF